MKAVSDAERLIIGVRSVQGRIVCARGLEQQVTLREHDTSKRMDLLGEAKQVEEGHVAEVEVVEEVMADLGRSKKKNQNMDIQRYSSGRSSWGQEMGMAKRRSGCVIVGRISTCLELGHCLIFLCKFLQPFSSNKSWGRWQSQSEE